MNLFQKKYADKRSDSSTNSLCINIVHTIHVDYSIFFPFINKLCTGFPHIVVDNKNACSLYESLI